MARRRAAILEVAAAAGADRLLIYGANRFGSAIQWLSGWPVTREAALLVGPDEPDLLLVQFHNHVPLARELAPGAEVRWAGPSTTAAVLHEVVRRGGYRQRLGVIGPLGFATHAALSAAVGDVADLSGTYTGLRLVKSDEELEWLRHGAALSDLAIDALDAHLASGLSEHEVVDLIERSYVPHGGATHIHYVGVTPMADPGRAAPAQYPSGRRTRAGDALVTEISAAWGGYAGQVLRTFAIDAEPTPLYRALHDVAEEAFHAVLGVLRDGATPREVIDAAAVIEDAGFTVCDDLLHGFGGGYLPPVLGSRSRPAGPLPDLTFRAGMTVVVQPNVVTTDGLAGVQTGELVLVTASGVQRLHSAAPGVHRVGA